MPNAIANQSNRAGFDVRKSDQSARDARRNEINRIEEEFYARQDDLKNFVQIGASAYDKSSVRKVTFGDTQIYVRFSTGDVIEVTEEQLLALTS
jgi:predicted NUDIX family phosphoesterase